MVNGDSKNLQIAPLILIPFVENAFKYGIKLEKESDIIIQLELENSKLSFSAENVNFKTNNTDIKLDTGVGLTNVKKRLDLIYPQKHSLNISEIEGKFRVKLRIDLD
jgi:LytS/YehU family sensor histidine kinase